MTAENNIQLYNLLKYGLFIRNQIARLSTSIDILVLSDMDGYFGNFVINYQLKLEMIIYRI